MASSVKATAKKKMGKGKAHEIHVERADGGGFISRTHFKQPEPKGRGMMAMGRYVEPTVTAHPDLDSVHDHLDTHFGDQADLADNGAGTGDNDGDENA